MKGNRLELSIPKVMQIYCSPWQLLGVLRKWGQKVKGQGHMVMKGHVRALLVKSGAAAGMGLHVFQV